MTTAAAPLADIRPLDDPQLLLAVWDEAAAVPACAVGAVLLRRSGVVDDLQEALDLPLSVVAALLLRLWTATFGPTAECLVGCPGCGEDLEVALPLDALAALPEQAPRAVVGESGLVVRCPATRDLLAITAAASPADALLGRSLTDAAGRPVDPAELEPGVRADVEAAAERLGGPAASFVTAACPRCGTPVRVDVDPVELLWQRLRAEVPAVLADVADLAAGFGWSEADVLGLSPARRTAYLDLLRDRS